MEITAGYPAVRTARPASTHASSNRARSSSRAGMDRGGLSSRVTRYGSRVCACASSGTLAASRRSWPLWAVDGFLGLVSCRN